MSRRECEELNYHEIGRLSVVEKQDAQLDHFRHACGKDWGLEPDLKAFEQGRASGIAEVCTPAGVNAYAARGFAYPSFCPIDKQKDFQSFYQSGQLLYLSNSMSSMREEVKSLKDKISDQNSEISRLKDELEDARKKK